MSEKVAVVVAAGREVRLRPVGLDRWRAVRRLVRAVIAGSGGAVFTDDAVGYGVWNGRSEESVTAAGEVGPAEVDGILFAASQLAQDHQQDAVAVTFGITVLVGEECPVGGWHVAQRLRALADTIEEEAPRP